MTYKHLRADTVGLLQNKSHIKKILIHSDKLPNQPAVQMRTYKNFWDVKWLLLISCVISDVLQEAALQHLKKTKKHDAG